MLPEEIRQMRVGSFVMIADNAPPVQGTFSTYIDRSRLHTLTTLTAPGHMTITPVDGEGEGQEATTYAPEEL